MTALGAVICYFICACIIFTFFYTLADHKGWDRQNKNPDPNASIVKIDQNKSALSFFIAKMQTTVHFSDGFYYSSYRTNKSRVDINHIKISVDKQMTLEIVEKAMKAHEAAVKKLK